MYQVGRYPAGKYGPSTRVPTYRTAASTYIHSYNFMKNVICCFLLSLLVSGRPLDDCPTCPWNRPDMGPYPPPFNALKGFETVHRGNFFDVYGDWITNRYSEVFWTSQPPLDLPDEIVKRYAGKVISFTGFEVCILLYNCDGRLRQINVPDNDIITSSTSLSRLM